MTAIKTLLLVLALMKTSTQSIVGVTYMDDFDFEERYSDPNDCNPFYWHPLHLPERCAEIFETAIRSKVAAFGPVRIQTKRPKHTRNHEYEYEHDSDRSHHHSNLYDFLVPVMQRNAMEPSFFKMGHVYTGEEVKRHHSPYGKMMDMLRNDISYLPTAPKITALPGLGLVALYEQPISKQSEKSIKEVAELYKKIYQQRPYPYPTNEIILKYSENMGGKDKRSSDTTTVKTGNQKS